MLEGCWCQNGRPSGATTTWYLWGVTAQILGLSLHLCPLLVGPHQREEGVLDIETGTGLQAHLIEPCQITQAPDCFSTYAWLLVLQPFQQCLCKGVQHSVV